MNFISAYRNIRAALHKGGSPGEKAVNDFIRNMEGLATLTTPQLQQVDAQCLEEYQQELQTQGVVNTKTDISDIVFPFLAVYLSDLFANSNSDNSPGLTQFCYQNGTVPQGSELSFLRNQFLEYIFAADNLPLPLRRWFFERVVEKSYGLPTDVLLVREAMPTRMVILAQRHAQNDPSLITEAKEIIRLVERSDALTKALLAEWGLKNTLLSNWWARFVSNLQNTYGMALFVTNLRNTYAIALFIYFLVSISMDSCDCYRFAIFTGMTYILLLAIASLWLGSSKSS